MNLKIRPARADDILIILCLIADSLRKLSGDAYSSEQISQNLDDTVGEIIFER